MMSLSMVSICNARRFCRKREGNLARLSRWLAFDLLSRVLNPKSPCTTFKSERYGDSLAPKTVVYSTSKLLAIEATRLAEKKIAKMVARNTQTAMNSASRHNGSTTSSAIGLMRFRRDGGNELSPNGQRVHYPAPTSAVNPPF